MSTQLEAVAECVARLNESAVVDRFSGVALIARHGMPLVEESYGYASQGLGIRNRTDTLFNIGSATKMFTAVAIAQLVQQGSLRFNSLLSELLPGYESTVAGKVTVHHLLTHTSGMGSFWNESFQTRRTSLRTVSDYLRLFEGDSLAFEPGDRFAYSNAGFVVLGAIIEEVSGMSYGEYLRKGIFEPAGMKDTGEYELDWDVPNRAVGYVRRDEDRVGSYPRTNVSELPQKGSPAGGTFSTVFDLLRFSRALQSHQFLNEEFTRQLLTPRVRMGSKGTAWYAYGFGCHEVRGVRIVGHNGGAPGVGAQLDIFPDLGYTMVLLSNYDAKVSMEVVPVIRQVLAA